jgi:hypothetical protein
VLAATVGAAAALLTAGAQLLALRDGPAAVAAPAEPAISIGLAALMTLFVLWSLRGGLAVRVLAVAAVALNALMLMVSLVDVLPQNARIAAMAAMALQPITAALLFAPAVGSYRSARRVGAVSGRAHVQGVPLR